jgi:glyoxylase-like metal-dependent hydrolase (beta-lactamase superfamily II)
VDHRTEQLAPGVWRVEVALYVNAFVVANDGHSDREGITVIDTGLRSSGTKLVRSIRLAGLDPRSVSDVLLTHWHIDHAGSAARFASSSAAPRVWVGAGDRDVVAGRQPPPRPERGQVSRAGRVMAPTTKPATPVPDVRALDDGDGFPAAGGVQVVAAPGHTRGHVAYLLPEQGVLVAGDAIWNVWWLSRGPRFLCTALPAVPATLRRLAALEYDTLAVAHGPAVTARARERVAGLVD